MRTTSNIFMETPVPTQAQFDLNRQFLADTLAATGQDPIPDDYGFGRTPSDSNS